MTGDIEDKLESAEDNLSSTQERFKDLSDDNENLLVDGGALDEMDQTLSSVRSKMEKGRIRNKGLVTAMLEDIEQKLEVMEGILDEYKK